MTVRALVLAGMLTATIGIDAQQPTRFGQAVTPQAPRPAVVETPPQPRFATPPPTPPPPTPTPDSPGQIAARRAGQSVNVKLDVTLHDQTGNDPRRTKTVSVVTADGLSGFVRTTAFYDGPGIGDVPLNIDVEPRILTGGKIRVLLNLQYTLPALSTESPRTQAVLRQTQIRENLSLVLDEGRSLVVAQSADPVGDRRVTVEVVATILK